MLFSTNRIKELRLRIDTFELLTNQDFYIHLVKRKRFLSSFFTRPSGFSRARNPFPLALRTPATQANHDLARKIGKYKSDDITAAKFFTTPLLCSWQIKLQTTPWLYLHSTDPTKLKLQYYTTPLLPPPLHCVSTTNSVIVHTNIYTCFIENFPWGAFQRQLQKWIQALNKLKRLTIHVI